MGSDLAADASVVESHGQDSAFWPITIRGQDPQIPQDGQVVSVTLKGTVYREKGAAAPATLIHFQSLLSADGSGSRVVWLTSQGFDMPIDQPNAVTTFKPENLCVKQGGVVAFNDIGGFMYGGSLSAPLDPRHYHDGAPFAVFGAVRDSITARFSGDNATKNGNVVTTSGADPAHAGGTVSQGEELLMQYVLATGDDRSEPCGGPRRHPDGSLVVIPSEQPQSMRVITPQRPYVVSTRRFATGVYCGGPKDCAGTAVVKLKKRRLARRKFTVPAHSSYRISMKLKRGDYRRLMRSRGRKLRVRYVLRTTLGTFRAPLTIRR